LKNVVALFDNLLPIKGEKSYKGSWTRVHPDSRHYIITLMRMGYSRHFLSIHYGLSPYTLKRWYSIAAKGKDFPKRIKPVFCKHCGNEIK